MAVGRISGPLLKDNLLRDGVNLAFETDLVYLDVINGRVGIKTASPTNELSVNGTTKTTNLEVSTQATVANFTISGSTIASSSGIISLVPSGTNPAIYQSKINVNSNLQISTNTIETTVNNTDININTLGTGQLIVNADTLINGNLHATGVITADGNITLGDANTDNIVFKADVASNLVPDITNTYSLGTDPATGGKEWANLYAHNIYASTINTSALVVNGINLVLPQGNIIYVATTGSDSNAGVHENNPVLTIKYALSLATTGTTVYIYPGTYTEIFPLTIPAGVSVKGAGIRAVNITPTAGTVTKDAFLLNGETTVEDVSISGFRYDGAGNTGYGFRFANNFTVITRSPYIRNVTVITKGSTTSASDPYGFASNDAGKGVLADGSVANSSSKEATMLFHGVTFFTPNQESVIATNGVRIEWLNSFTYFADKSMYAYSSAAGFAGAGLTRLRINNRVGTWAVGNTVTYYDTDRTTVLASGTIASIDGNYVNLTGRATGFQTITDRSAKTLYAQGNAKLSTSIKKFGTASLALDGVGDYVTCPAQPDFEFGTGAWTIEAWVYNTTNPGTVQTIFDFRNNATPADSIILNIQPTGEVHFSITGSVLIASTAVVATNSWTHIALSCNGTSTKLFVNGTQSGSTYTDNNNYIQGPLTIGARFDGTLGFNGYIDDVRISKGVARYTTTFTAPTSALTGDNSTVLLLHFNGVNNSTTIVDDGVTLQDLRTSASGTASLINFADYSDFGAEIRSLGSASIYGTYGIYGDGPGVIIYLVSHNLSYVGAGKLTTNDPNDRIAVNEIVKLNSAKIYYSSVDNEGNFKVGDNFYVNQKTGDVTFNNQNLSINSLLGVTFTDGVNTTTLLSTGISTGNIQISGNTVESLTGPLNVVAANGITNLQNNTFVTGNLDVTGNLTIGGNITIGDASTDSINFIAAIASDLIPATTATYNLGQGGGTPLRWNNIYLSRAEVDGLVIDNNTISTTVGNDNLTLIANGTGKVLVPSNNVQIDQSLTVGQNLTVTAGTTALQAVGITGTLTQTGDFTQSSGNFSTTGTINSGAITSTGTLTLPNVTIANSTITGTTSATNLVLTPYAGQKVEITSNAQLDSNATVGGTLGVTGISTLAAVGITGTLTQTGNFTQTSGNFSTTGTINSGAITSTGTLTLPNVTIANSTITGTTTATNLVLTPYSGKQVEITSNAQLDGSATIGGTLGVTGISTLAAVGITGTLTQTGNFTQTSGNFSTTGTINSGAITSTGTLTLPNLNISGSTITGITSNTNLVLTPYTGKQVEITSDAKLNSAVTIGGTLGVTGISTLAGVGITGTLTQTGNFVQTGNFTTSGDASVTGNITGTGTLTLPAVTINSSTISGTASNTDLQLTANGSGRIYIPNNNVRIDNNLSVGGTFGVTGTSTLADVGITGTLTQTGNFVQTGNFTTSGDLSVTGNATITGAFSIPNITISGSTITTNTGNLNLTLTANGTGGVIAQGIKVNGSNIQSTATDANITLTPNGTGRVVINSNQSLVIPVGTTGQRPLTPTNGMIRYNTDLSRYEGYNSTYSLWLALGGVQDADGNTYIKAEATPGANDNILYFYINGAEKARLDATKLSTLRVQTNNLDIQNNTIGALTSNTDIIFTTSGTGGVKVGNLVIKDNSITNSVSGAVTEFAETGTGYVKITGTNGVVIPSGDISQLPPNPETGMVRFNTYYSYVEVFNGTTWINAAGVTSGISISQAQDIGIVSALLFG